MARSILGSALVGIDAVPISVQIDSNPGLHSFTIVGLGDKAVQESIERIESAVKHCGFTPPKAKNKRLIVNLSPADLKKEGPGYDLPIAIAYLLISNQVAGDAAGIIFIGELGLDGTLGHTNGVLAAALMAAAEGAHTIVVPSCNYPEASLVEGVRVLSAGTLTEAVMVSGLLSPGAKLAPGDRGDTLVPIGTSVTGLSPGDTVVTPGDTDLAPGDTLAPPPDTVAPSGCSETLSDDSFAYIRGQFAAKRALVIGAAGGHNILMTGAPGSGKTILARSLVGLLPALTTSERIEVAKIHSAAGLMRGSPLGMTRPFRSPHHTSSPVSVIGGGTTIRPGQVSLAHRGVLFLDEMPEFARNVLEALRQPLEDGVVTVSRASGSLTLPAKFMLVGAMNPCPCGNAGDPRAICFCTVTARSHYVKKISGPLMDRMDIQVSVARETVSEEHAADHAGFRSAREAIAAARQLQRQRFTGSGLMTNSEITHKTVAVYCHMTSEANRLLRDTVNQLRLSLRAYHKVQKVARTIADLAACEQIEPQHIAEALALRVGDRLNSV